MTDTDSLAQTALTIIASSRAHAEKAPGPYISVFLTKDQADALIAEVRSLRSRLAEAQQLPSGLWYHLGSPCEARDPKIMPAGVELIRARFQEGTP